MKYGAAIISAIVLTLASCKEKEIENDDFKGEVPEKTEVSGRECYLKVTGRDSMIFTMERTGDSVRGIFHWKPYEKDTKIQEFRGTLSNGSARAIAEVSAEGMNTKEELDFTVNNNAVIVKYGEMEQGKDGIWRYKAGAPASVQVLPKAECLK